MQGPAAVWNSAFWTVLAVELAVFLLAVRTALPRRRAAPRLHLKGTTMNNSTRTAPARARRGARLRAAAGRRVPRRAVLHAGLAARHLGDERQLAQPVPERRGIRHAHLPHVAVLLHRGLLRAPAAPEARRAADSGRTARMRIALPLVAGWVVAVPADRPRLVRPASPRCSAARCRRCREMPTQPGVFPLTHLWFLYQLLLIYVAVTRVRALIVAPRSARRNCAALVDAVVAAPMRTRRRGVHARHSRWPRRCSRCRCGSTGRAFRLRTCR